MPNGEVTILSDGKRLDGSLSEWLPSRFSGVPSEPFAGERGAAVSHRTDGHIPLNQVSPSKYDESTKAGYKREDGKIFDHNARRYIDRNNTLTRQERRAYQRLTSGLTMGDRQGSFMRFMTLTTASGVKKDINRSFERLKKRIMRASWEKDGFSGFKCNKYFKVKTAEGNGVLHTVLMGNYIPQAWLSKTWAEIHGSPIVDIRALRVGRKGVKGIANYLVSNYLVKQPILRMSYGWKWLWLGAVRSWKNIIKTYGWKSTLRVWSFLMREPLVNSRQSKIIKFC